MNIDLNGQTYEMTTMHVVDNEMYMYLKDNQNRMYQKSVNDIVLLLYKNKALSSFHKYQTMDELKHDLLNVDLFLSDVPSYQYLKKQAQGFKLKQDQLNQMFQSILKAYDTWKKQIPPKVVEAPKEMPSQKSNPFQHMSENELLFHLQMNPNSPDNDAIREELEKRATSRRYDANIQGGYNNEMIKVKKLEQRSNLGFALNALLSFLAGMVVGIWGLVIINLLVKYL